MAEIMAGCLRRRPISHIASFKKISHHNKQQANQQRSQQALLLMQEIPWPAENAW
jgi:hypothetical protein